MDEEQRKKYPSLPPNYVSFAQLQQRWLQKQEDQRKEEEELKKQQEKQSLAETQKQEIDIENHGKTRQNGKKVETPSGQEMRVIEGIVKDEEMKIGGSRDDENTSRISKEKKKTRNRQKKKFWKIGSRVIENEEKEIPGNGNGFHGKIEKIDIDGASGNKVVEIPGSTLKEGFYGGLQGSVCTVEVLPENGVREKIQGRNGNRKKFRGGLFLRNHKNERTDCRIKENSVEMVELKENEELAPEKKGRERNDKNGRRGYRIKDHGVKGEDLNGTKTAPAKVGDEVLVGESKRNSVEGGVWNGFSKNANSNVEMDELKHNEEPVSEKKGKERKDMNRRTDYKTKDREVKEEDLNETGIAEKLVDEILVGGSERSYVKGVVKNGFRRNENWRGKIREKFENLTLNDGEAGNVASRRVIVNSGDKRRYGNSGRFGNNLKMNQEHGMMWVVKKQISDANETEIEPQGTSQDWGQLKLT